MMRVLAGIGAACLLGVAVAPEPGDAATSLYIVNHVNSNEVQGLTAWQGGLAAATLGGVVLVHSNGSLTKVLRSPNGLPSNLVLCVAQSPSGALWAGTDGAGIGRMKSDGSFRRALTSFDGLPNDHVQALYVTGDSVWVGTSGGVALLTENPATGQVQLRRSDTSASTGGALVSDDVMSFQQAADTLWCGTGAGLSSFAGGAWTGRRAALGIATRSLALRADTLWAATAAGPMRYGSGSFALAAAGHVGGSAVLRSIGGTLYSGSDAAGPFVYGAGAWTAMSTLGAGLPSPHVSGIEALGGALWIGTSGGLASNPAPPAGAWSNELSPGPAVNGTQRAAADSRGVWFATGNFFPPTGLGAVLHYDGAAWSVVSPVSSAGQLQAAAVFGILSDRSAILWFGHCCSPNDPKPRLDRWNPATDQWDRPATTNIYTLAQSPGGLVYAGSVEHGNGVYEFDGTTAALLDSLTPANTSGGLSTNNLRGIAFDSQGRAWIATATSGLDIADEKGTIGNHADDVWLHLGAGLPSLQTSAVVTDGPKSGWVGTIAGVARIRNDAVDPVATFAVTAALPATKVQDLALDAGGNLWIATSGGLGRVDAKTGSVESFTTADGLAGDDVRSLAWDAAHSALWAGTVDGISQIYPGGSGAPAFGSGTYLYPNPLGPAATSLHLGGITGAVDGEVRDVTGTVIRSFHCNPAQTEAWDLRTADGAMAAPGIYLVVLRGDGRSQVLRAAVVR